MARKLIFSFHHLSYTDDVLLLSDSSQLNARGIAGVLHHLFSFTGLVDNKDKSSLICSGTRLVIQKSSGLGFKEARLPSDRSTSDLIHAD